MLPYFYTANAELCHDLAQLRNIFAEILRKNDSTDPSRAIPEPEYYGVMDIFLEILEEELESALAFLNLPGVFTFVTDEIDIRAKRPTGILMEDLYGRLDQPFRTLS